MIDGFYDDNYFIVLYLDKGHKEKLLRYTSFGSVKTGSIYIRRISGNMVVINSIGIISGYTGMSMISIKICAYQCFTIFQWPIYRKTIE
jgi:hypothetical protein